MLAMQKGEHKDYFEKVKTDVQMWCNKDKTHSIQREFLAKMKECLEIYATM